MKDIINILDLSSAEIDELIDVAADIRACPGKYREACRGKTLATLFFEPSTRTRLSFEAAMYGLGGNVIGFAEEKSSSASKGESVSDTARIVSIYSDIIVMRHYTEGAPFAASLVARVPLINAGDGGHYHPTQTLADLFTIKDEFGRLGDLTIGICGDLKYGRTVHSLISALSRYGPVRFVLISPPSLALPEYVKREFLTRGGISFVESDSLEAHMGELDILYMTRSQRERFSEDERASSHGKYILTPEKLGGAKEKMCVLHPLPRVDEIDVALDADPRAKYFTQAENGKFIRMALILKLLGEGGDKGERDGEACISRICRNPKCITAAEGRLPPRNYLSDDGTPRCRYCDSELREDVQGEDF